VNGQLQSTNDEVRRRLDIEKVVEKAKELE